VSDGFDIVETIQRGVRAFNRRRYLEAQETWETAMACAEVGDRALLEGLVQLAGGLHLRTHHDGTRGAVHLIGQSMILLEDFRPHAHGLDIETLVTEFTAYVDWLKRVERPYRFADRFRVPVLR
jgi:predicted metal-dependent hydrolase